MFFIVLSEGKVACGTISEDFGYPAVRCMLSHPKRFVSMFPTTGKSPTTCLTSCLLWSNSSLHGLGRSCDDADSWIPNSRGRCLRSSVSTLLPIISPSPLVSDVGKILSIGLISTALRGGTPIPQITPCPLLDRFLRHNHGLNIALGEEDNEYGLPRTATVDLLEDEQYMYGIFPSYDCAPLRS